MSLDDDVKAFEKQKIVETLVQTGGNVSAAARALQVKPHTFWRKIKLHMIDVEKIRTESNIVDQAVNTEEET